MLIRCISAEWLKLRHSRIWIILVTLPIISVLIGSANFYINQGVLAKEWYSLWSQVGLFYGEFFFPILISICCAYSWRLEHLNKNWNMIMTAPVSAASIFLSKMLVVGLLLIFVQILFFLLYLIGGKLVGLTSAPPSELFEWFIQGWIASLTISAMQLALSMRYRSFAVPIGIGLCATFLGLAMYVLDLGMLFPHSLLTTGMGVLSQSDFSSQSEYILFLITNLLYIIVISLVAIRWMRRKDVVA
ncbi:ABC transporter permease [Lysinibacillus odysseyi]|uniref:Multidrug ABC transporter permease n=1 Tax=Lysinibacillus odysseyi 34hs-1 = NBRC 100172 TaxID=1220589 RepID=A0A0A3IJ26_9BACI|nr:ABC transporter permease [Lysinibacillus odysseyi]KGR82793.1 multidrug ABC transporter permease [Lysinibacillus odysseyi 34hs-1 = NBRC 100172]